MSANAKAAAEPLDQIQSMLNEVIVQIGKALRASSKQPGRRNVAQVQASLQNRVPDSIESFHSALDDLESEVVRAKGALQRDLERIRARRAPPQEQKSLTGPKAEREVKTEAPSTTSGPPLQQPSPAVELKEEPRQSPKDLSSAAAAVPMAPFPDMGGGAAPAAPMQVADMSINSESTPSAPQAMMGPAVGMGTTTSDEKPSLAAPEAPMADMLSLEGNGNGNDGGAGAAAFNFTDMTFDLAPASNESQNQPGLQDSNMDMSGFGSADDTLSLDQLLPPDAAGQTDSSNNPADTAAKEKGPAEEKPADLATANGGKTDLTGDDMMDLDLDVGDGGDMNNFDDMFFDNSNAGELIFNDEFFGID